MGGLESDSETNQQGRHIMNALNAIYDKDSSNIYKNVNYKEFV